MLTILAKVLFELSHLKYNFCCFNWSTDAQYDQSKCNQVLFLPMVMVWKLNLKKSRKLHMPDSGIFTVSGGKSTLLVL